MEQHNLYSRNGYPLNYPHFTLWDNKNNVCLVTDPEKKISKGDVVFVAIESRQGEDIVYNYIYKRAEVLKVIEERKAKGEHNVYFKPIFQKLSVKYLPEEN